MLLTQTCLRCIISINKRKEVKIIKYIDFWYQDVQTGEDFIVPVEAEITVDR